MKTTTPAFTREGFTPTPASWREQIVFLQEVQKRKAQQSYSRDFARITIDSDQPIGIVLSSDWHVGSSGSNYEILMRHLSIIENNPRLYMALLSNTIDNFLFPSGMFHQMINPEEQMEIVRGFSEEFAQKIVAVVGSRCHEGWTTDRTSLNPNSIMFESIIREGTPYFANGGVLEIELDHVLYSFGLVHKARGHSALNPTNANRALHDTRWPVDVIAVAHHHVKQILQGQRYEGKYQKDVTYFRTGAYKIDDAYSELEGFGKGEVGSPVAVIFPHLKKVIPFYRIEDADMFLKSYGDK